MGVAAGGRGDRRRDRRDQVPLGGVVPERQHKHPVLLLPAYRRVSVEFDVSRWARVQVRYHTIKYLSRGLSKI